MTEFIKIYHIMCTRSQAIFIQKKAFFSDSNLKFSEDLVEEDRDYANKFNL